MPLLVDYHIHTLGHDSFHQSDEELALYCQTALSRGLKEIGFAEHDYYRPHFDPERFQLQAKRFPRLVVRVGVEVDYVPGREAEIRAFLREWPFDFVIGSVHQVDGFSFDVDTNIPQYADWETTDLFRRYYACVAQAAASGLFDIIGHLDLIKIFNFVPPQDAINLALPALAAIADAGLCIELNTNGRHKPAHDFYPTQALLEECSRLGIPLTLGSDAHRPQDAGRDIHLAATLAWRAGYRKIAIFSNRRRFLVPLG
ncbi:MAG: histidinol-phosphatase family [Bacillota bacterium]|jgi:histidinol-phosphatase (PHP family)|nr:histidinol-phosphatase family [Bacillota bacterium]MDK2882090.1 histidinol-phosphatase family [Bacillota bacterium]